MVGSRFAIITVVCAALAAGTTSHVFASAQKESIRYSAVSIPKFKAAWYDRLETGLTKAGSALKVDVTQVVPSPADVNSQAQCIEDAVNQGNNAVFVVPVDPASIESALARARSKKVVTITHQSPQQEDADFDVEMIDPKAFGQLAMDEMVKAMDASGPPNAPAGEYAVFVGSFTAPDHNAWADAAISLARQNYPGLKLVGERFAVSEDLGLSRQTALDLLAAYPGIKAFLAFGSQGGPGAAQAVREKGLVGKISVIGTTGPDQAAPYLRDGSLAASIVWDPAEAGYAMMYIARLVLDGKGSLIGPDLAIPGLGKPFSFAGNTLVYNRPIVLTRDNVDNYSGF
jgi:simple sugar transport system substrate-binding protein